METQNTSIEKPQVVKKKVKQEARMKLSASLYKLLTEPENYAKGAIDCLEKQISRVISKKKKMILEGRLSDWKQFLEEYEEKNRKDAEATATEITTAEKAAEDPTA